MKKACVMKKACALFAAIMLGMVVGAETFTLTVKDVRDAGGGGV